MATSPPTSPTPPPPALDPAGLGRLMFSHGHGRFLGLAYRDHGDDWVEVELPWRADLVGVEETGVLASGPIISLLDSATSFAVWVRRQAFIAHATLDLRIDYMRAAVPGRTVVARAECYQVRRAMSFVRGIAHDGDAADPVASVTGIFMVTDPRA